MRPAEARPSPLDCHSHKKATRTFRPSMNRVAPIVSRLRLYLSGISCNVASSLNWSDSRIRVFLEHMGVMPGHSMPSAVRVPADARLSDMGGGPQYFLGGGFLLLLLLLDFTTLSVAYHNPDNAAMSAPAVEQEAATPPVQDNLILVVLGEAIPGAANWAFEDVYQVRTDSTAASSEANNLENGANQDHSSTVMDIHDFTGEVSGQEAFGQEWGQLLGLTSIAGNTGLSEGAFLVPVQGAITSRFGEVRSNIRGLENSPHRGIDIAAVSGAPVVASNSGVVVFSDAWAVRGNGVVIDHGDGAFTGYYHLSTIQVSEGQDVSKGQVIGTVGSTGLSTGPHLHWEVIIKGSHIEPLSWVRSTGNQRLDSLVLAAASQEGVSPYQDRRLEDALPTALILETIDGDHEDEATSADQNPSEAGDAPAAESATSSDKSQEPAEARKKAEAARKAEAQQKAHEERLAGIRQMYISLLGREPERIGKTEIKSWDDTGLSVAELRPRIIEAGVRERVTAVVKIYIDLLGRDPMVSDEKSLLFWAKGDLAIAEIRKTVHSTGATERRVAIRKLYQTLLKRDPVGTDDIGLQSWVEGSFSIKAIEERLMASEEYKSRVRLSKDSTLSTQQAR